MRFFNYICMLKVRPSMLLTLINEVFIILKPSFMLNLNLPKLRAQIIPNYNEYLKKKRICAPALMRSNYNNETSQNNFRVERLFRDVLP